ncbi:MAG: TonB-dependent receptor domain-containing protein [Gemmatimonadota bacterium]
MDRSNRRRPCGDSPERLTAPGEYVRGGGRTEERVSSEEEHPIMYGYIEVFRRRRSVSGRWRSDVRVAAACLLALSITVASGPSGVEAQESGWIAGSVTAEDGAPLAGPSATVPGLRAGAVADADGEFLLGPVPAGEHPVEVSMLGYGRTVRTVDVVAGDTVRVAFTLAARPVELSGIDVSVLRPDLESESRLERRRIREANPRDAGEMLRGVSGVDAVRRGPVGLDPVVQGLRETEVGVYLDGTRIFPGGAARMDSPLSHLDPSTLESMRVVKGPYALTWGAGNMSAIRVETHDVPSPVPGPFHGEVLTGWDTNLNALESAVSAYGREDRVSYWTHAAWREGDDYASGSGDVVPADFLSREVRGKIGYRVAEGSSLTLSAGYQDQRDIDYPGRLLDADFFETYNFSARWSHESAAGALRSLEALAYVNDVDHGMDNDGKPTAEPMPGRTPPFALDVQVESGVSVRGGRLAAVLEPEGGPWQFEVGGDVYSAQRLATRTIARRDDGMVMFEDLMWPDATITDAGLFARASRPIGGRFSVAATARLDVVRADADTASPFFRDNVSGEPDASETNPSAAVTATALLNDAWSLSAGVGSVVRTADATERYSDRIPASKAQMSAEFVGNPALEPERSTQADVWLEATYPRLTLSFNAFVRRMDDYITLEATDLPKRLPLSPETVFRYVNGEAAFRGAEATASFALTDPLTLTLSGSYLYGEDRAFDEPALGVTPLKGATSLRYEPREGGFFVEGTLRAVGAQDRVASVRGESPTDGYATGDVQAGATVMDGALVRVGVNNLTDADYVNHLNAGNPFTGERIPEPGRVFFAKVSWSF